MRPNVEFQVELSKINSGLAKAHLQRHVAMRKNRPWQKVRNFLRTWRFVKWGKVIPPGALYRRWNWVGVIPLKFQEEMPVVGSTSHHRIRGTEHRLEHLMRYRELRSVRNSYGTRETTLSCVEIKGTCGIYFSNIKTPLFSSDRKGKPEFWEAIVGMQAQIYIRPWALSEEAQWSENSSTIRKE